MTRSEVIDMLVDEAKLNCERFASLGDFDGSEVERTMIKTQLDILLAEQKRIIGCDVCRGVKILHGTFCGTIPVDSDTQMEVDSDGDVDFDFCPVCGRKLSDAAHGVTNLESLLDEIANTRIKSAFYKFPKRMVFVGDFKGEAETRKEAIEREVEWLKEEKK